MDALLLTFLFAFFGLSGGLIALCSTLMGDGR